MKRITVPLVIVWALTGLSALVKADALDPTLVVHDGHVIDGAMAATPPVYFEESWAILSSIGIMNVMFGIMVMGIINPSPIAFVPIIVSAAGAIANGLCYYAFYANYSTEPSVVAGAFADIMWLIQEAGMSFYSYLILTKVLHGRPRLIFLSLFWTLMLLILILRIAILVYRASDLLSTSDTQQAIINKLHVGYFSALALVECLSTYFLLHKFAAASRLSVQVTTRSGIFPYLMRSTELRVATLSIVGIVRAITYSWRTTAQSATTVPEQVDRFVYTLECMFPVMMFIDMLGTRSVITNHMYKTHSRSLSETSTLYSPGITGPPAKAPRRGPPRAAKRHGSLSTLSLSGLSGWGKQGGLQDIAGSPSAEHEEKAVEGEKLITGFDFAFQGHCGMGRTVDFKPHAG